MVLKNNIKRGFAGLGVAALLGMSLVTGVSADTPTSKTNDVNLEIVSSTIGSNGLQLLTPEINDFGDIELQKGKTVHNTEFAGKFEVTDLRGTQEGYDLTVESNGFTNAATDHKLPVGTLTLDPLGSIERSGDGTAPMPTSSMETKLVIDEGAVEVLKADAGEGAGIFDVKFGADALGLTVDATTAKVGTYTSTLTWNLNSTPNAE